MAEKQKIDILALDRCPVSGLPIRHSPRWVIDEPGARPYCAEFSLIGDHIILGSVRGYTSKAISVRYLELLDTLCVEVLPPDGKFILMEDYSDHEGTSGEARNYYINRQKRNTRLAGVVYFHVSPVFSGIIRVGRMFVRAPFPVEIASDYPAAIRAALSLHGKASQVPQPAGAPQAGEERVWKLEGSDFSVDFRVLPGAVLFSASHGKMTTAQQVQDFENYYRRILQEWSPPGGHYFRLMDWSNLAHVSWRARGLYMQAMQRLQKEFPCRMAVLYGLTPFVRAVYSASRHFLPIPIETARNREEGLAMIRKYTVSRPVLEKAQPALLDFTAEEVDRQVCSLIDLMSAINWEQSGILMDEAMLEKAGPFRPLYEALFIFKQDYDEALQQRSEAVSRRRDIEEQLHHAEKMQTIGTLAGGIAHDFNNMLGGITGFASLLQKRYGALDPGIDRYAGMILDTGKRAAGLVENLLTFARKGRQEIVPVSLREHLNSLVALLSHTLDKGIRITLELQDGGQCIHGDRSQLQNLLLNLAINAADAMPGGGTLAISTKMRQIDSKTVASLVYPILPGEYVEISVTDTGAGIAPEIQGRIFEPFFTTKETGKGTGLGLSSVYGTLQGHSAGIAFESEVGRGTTFRLYFKPVAALPQNAAVQESPAGAQGKGRVLVVEDEPALRGVVQEMLAELGYESVACCDGQEAVEAFEREPDGFCLVLLDLVMPRLSGDECFKKIRDINPAVRVVVTTGFSQQGKVEALLASGAKGFLPKPYALDALSETLQKALKP